MPIDCSHQNSFLPIEDFNNRLEFQNIEKGDVLLQPGHVCKKLIIVNTGFLRVFNIKDGNEQINGFFGPGSIVFPVSTYHLLQKSNQAISSETSGSIFCISHHECRALEEKYPEFLQFSKSLSDQHIITLSKREKANRLGNAKEMYLYLCKEEPELLQNVPINHIASYLGISIQRLSEIRSEIAKERLI
ncbi:Crp/Fnr family transcriptional regulator [Pedobacter frigidisoli]|uniref:Crp/Fnr family transcriptional regulator n=1 Tax=Pedobacter frigidisoli TaxID=2530455 RepID=UPI00292DE514|nr:Crp/Fnr family transcriptional regulator [Pedobacter frigidisoli]